MLAMRVGYKSSGQHFHGVYFFLVYNRINIAASTEPESDSELPPKLHTPGTMRRLKVVWHVKRVRKYLRSGT